MFFLLNTSFFSCFVLIIVLKHEKYQYFFEKPKFDNIKNIINEPNFSFIHHDIIDPLSITENINEIYNGPRAFLFSVNGFLNQNNNVITTVKKRIIFK